MFAAKALPLFGRLIFCIFRFVIQAVRLSESSGKFGSPEYISVSLDAATGVYLYVWVAKALLLFCRLILCILGFLIRFGLFVIGLSIGMLMEKLIPSEQPLLKEIINSVLLFPYATGLGREGMLEMGE